MRHASIARLVVLAMSLAAAWAVHAADAVAWVPAAADADIDRAWEAVQYSEAPRIHVFLATSAIHREFKLKMDKREIIDRAIHGVGLAAQFYFGKEVQHLSLAESALLVAMVKGPTYYDPHRHPARTLERRNLVLREAREQNAIDLEQYAGARAAELGVSKKPGVGTSPYPAFLALVHRQLRRDYDEADLRSEGLRIFTTLDPRVQGAAERALQKRLAQFDKDKRFGAAGLEGAVVVTDPQSGEIQALVGGRDVRFRGFNRAVDAARPVGSLLKPVIYLTALSDPARYTLPRFLDDVAERHGPRVALRFEGKDTSYAELRAEGRRVWAGAHPHAKRLVSSAQ